MTLGPNTWQGANTRGASLSSIQGSGNPPSHSEILGEIRNNLEQNFGTPSGTTSAILQDLANEENPQIFFSDLLTLGREFQNSQQLGQAQVFYTAVAQYAPANLTEIKGQAQRFSALLRGEGSAGEQAELLASQFLEQATDPIMLGSMFAAQATFGLSRLGLMRGLPVRFAGGSHLARVATANTVGFALEGMAFVGTHHGLARAVGRPLPEGMSLAQELGHTYLTLGLLKGAGSISQALLRARLGGLHPGQLSLFDRFSTVALPQVAMFGGIYGGQWISPHLGLGEELNGTQRLLQSLNMLFQFNLAGGILNAMPGYGRTNQWMHQQTQQAMLDSAARARGVVRDFIDPPVPDFVTPEGIRISQTNRGNPLESNTVMMAGVEGQEGSGPPRASSSAPPPGESPRGGAGRKRSLSSRALRYGGRKIKELLEWTARQDLNRTRHPEKIPEMVRRAELPQPVQSVEQGLLLAMAREGGQRQVAHTRMALELLRDFPETQKAFMEVQEARLEFQRGIRERLDPILSRLPNPPLKPVADAVRAYERTISEQLGGNTTKYEADALIHFHNAELMKDAGMRKSLTEEDLIRMGYDPLALGRAKDNVEKFFQGAIERIIEGNPELKNAVGADKVVETARNYDPLEASRAAISKRGKLKIAVRDYLKDEQVAHLWLVETALQNSVRELMRSNAKDFLEQVAQRVEQNKPESISEEKLPEFMERLNRWRHASLNLQSERQLIQPGRFSNVQGLFDGVLRLFGMRDYQPLHRAVGEYEKSLIDLLTHHETDLLPLGIEVLRGRYEATNDSQRAALLKSRSELMTQIHELATTQREGLEKLEPEITEFFNYHDQNLIRLRELGLWVGWMHVGDLFDRIKTGMDHFEADVAPRFRKMGGTLSEMAEGQSFSRDIAPKLEEMESRLNLLIEGRPGEDRGATIEGEREEIIGYLPAAERAIEGKMNPLYFNRNIEAPLKVVMAGYELALKTADRNGIQLGEVRRIIPFFESYAHRADLKQVYSLGQRIASISQYLWPALTRILRLNSSLNKGYGFSVGATHFLEYGQALGDKTAPQTFYVPRDIEPVADYLRFVTSGDHNTQPDFLGLADNIVQAMLGDRAEGYAIPDIAAKLDLVVPIIEEVFPHLTNPVGYTPVELAAAIRRATQMQALGGLEHGRLHPTMPLGYDNITMDVTNGESPYILDPAPPITGSLPVMGRFFEVAEGATAITARPQGIAFVQDPGAVRNFPGQRFSKRELPTLLKNPTSMAAFFMPFGALPEPANRAAKVTLRNNIERLMWYLQGFHPEMDPPAPYTDRLYEDYFKPSSPRVESMVAQLYQGASEVYPNREGIANLEARRRELELKPKDGQNQREASLINQALDVQTRTLLRNRLDLLDQELARHLQYPSVLREFPGLRRMQRILRSRLKLLGSAERKIAKGQELSLTERRFLEKAGAAIAGRDIVSGRDHILEQLDFYFEAKNQGQHPQERFEELQNEYQEFIRNWNERRKDPENPEYQQLHVSEAEGYLALRRQYHTAVETLYSLHGLTPKRWEGGIFPEMVFRREGDRTLIEPLGWKPLDNQFSRGKLWRYLIDDTGLGMVPLAVNMGRFDRTKGLYMSLHQAWGHRTLATTQTRLVLENTDKIREVGNHQSIIAPTHDSGAEFATITAALMDYGLNAFFMADRKFFDAGFHPPAFGLIRRLLGPLELYGHFSIDRSDRRSALESMIAAGKFVSGQPYKIGKEKFDHEPRSIIIFPGATRNPVRYDEQGNRYEGTLYGNKGGIGLSFGGANKDGHRTAVLPMGLINGGILFPKQALDAFITGGAGIGREYIFRFGDPIWRDTMFPGNPKPKDPEVRTEIVENLNRQFHELTGREVGPPAESKAKDKKK